MMPILTLQRRLREIGRIRIGEQVPMSNGRTRPAKLEAFRLTSRDQQVIETAASVFGGTCQPWTAPDGQQWEVKTSTDQLQVVVPPSEMAFSQFYEQWSAGGCQARCDGQWDYLNEKECHCDPENRSCAIHSRLSVMLTDLPGLGVWRLDTSGFYAATELAGIVELCQAFAARGQMLPARLRLEQRSVTRPVNGQVQTRRFAVPVLDLDVHPLALIQGGASGTAELQAGPSFQPVPESLPSAPIASIADQTAAVGNPQPKSRRANAAEPLRPTGLKPRPAAAASAPAGDTGAPTCARCGSSLAGCAVDRDGAGFVHKGGCPTTETAATDGGGGVDAGTAVPAAPASPAPGEVYRDLDLLKLAGEVFDSARQAAPRGQKSKIVDRLRHALTWAVTEGRATSTKDLTPAEKHKLWMELSWLRDGFAQWQHDDDQLVISRDDRRVVILFADVEAEGAAA